MSVMDSGTSQPAGATPNNPTNPYDISGGGTPSTAPSGNTLSVTLHGTVYTVNLSNQLKGGQPAKYVPSPVTKGVAASPFVRGSGIDMTSVAQNFATIESWYTNSTKRAQITQQLYAAGLISSKKAPSTQELVVAWAHVVQEAALENLQKGGSDQISPEDLLAKAAQSGWNSLGAILPPGDSGLTGTGNLNNAADASTTSSQTVYKSYLDPATIMGAQADAWFRLMGRNPTQQEYKSFLDSVFAYQDADNTGKFESQTKDASDTLVGGNANNANGLQQAQTDPTTQTTTISQRGIGTRGLQFLAGQAAMANPEEGAYQAATTYFNAFIKALSGPASGMQASGPTTTVP